MGRVSRPAHDRNNHAKILQMVWKRKFCHNTTSKIIEKYIEEDKMLNRVLLGDLRYAFIYDVRWQ
jgi:hypothetical protein